MSISRRKNSHKKTHVRNKLGATTRGTCNVCGTEALIFQRHVGRKHRKCTGTAWATRLVQVPGYAYAYDGSLLHGVIKGPDGEPYRRSRIQRIGDSRKRGVWEG